MKRTLATLTAVALSLWFPISAQAQQWQRAAARNNTQIYIRLLQSGGAYYKMRYVIDQNGATMSGQMEINCTRRFIYFNTVSLDGGIEDEIMASERATPGNIYGDLFEYVCRNNRYTRW